MRRMRASFTSATLVVMEIATKIFHGERLRAARFSAACNVYLLTATTLNREPHFAKFETARIAAAYIGSPSTWGDSKLLAWVLMPDHWHGLLQLGASSPLATHMQRFKGGSSLLCQRHRQNTGRFWQAGYHDHALRKEEDIRTTARYIIQNPLRAGLVDHVGAYPFWDAVWL